MEVLQRLPKEQTAILTRGLELLRKVMEPVSKGEFSEVEHDIKALQGLIKSGEVIVELKKSSVESFAEDNGVDFPAYPIGFTEKNPESYMRTLFEVTNFLTTRLHTGGEDDEVVIINQHYGMTEVYTLARGLTDKFERLHKDTKWEGQYVEVLENFLEGELDNKKTYTYSLEGGNVRISFDHGEVEARDEEEALKLAKAEMHNNLNEIRTSLRHWKSTSSFDIQIDLDQIEVNLKEK